MGVLQITRSWNSAADLPDVSKCFRRIRSKHPCQRPPRYFAWGCFRYFSWKREPRRPLRLTADACSAEFTTRQSSRLEHDPEKHALGLDPGVDTGFPSRQTRSVCAEIMLKQKDRAG